MPGVLSTVSNLGGGKPQPAANADTIVASLQPIGDAGAVALVRAAAETGRIGDYTAKGCTGRASGPGLGTQLGVVTAQAGLQAGASALKIGSKALDAIPIVGSLIGAAISFIGMPFQHHAQAVQTEQATLCAAVPDAQNFLALVDQYVQTAQWDHVTAIQQMEAGFESWRLEVKAILQDTGGKCNAACVYEKAFRAAIEKRKVDYLQAETTFGNAGKGLVNSVSNSVGGVVQKVSDFLKGTGATAQQGVLASPNFRLFIGAGLVIVVAGGTFWIFSRMSQGRHTA